MPIDRVEDFDIDIQRAREWLNSRNIEWKTRLSRKELSEFNQYVNNTADINKYLLKKALSFSDITDETKEQTIALTKQAIAKAPIKEPIFLYVTEISTSLGITDNLRDDTLSISFDKAQQLSDRILNSRFQIDTFIKSDLTLPSSSESPIILHLKVPANSSAAPIDEKSVLLDSNHTIQVNNMSIINIKGREYIKVDSEIVNVTDFRTDEANALIWAKENYKEWNSKLSKNDTATIKKLLSTQEFINLTDYLLREDETKNSDPHLNNQVKTIQDALKSSVSPENIIVYARANPDLFFVQSPAKQDFNKKANVDSFIHDWEGQTIEMPQFIFGSLSSSPSNVDAKQKILMRIEVPKGFRGAYINFLSESSNVAQFLLPRNIELKITKITPFADESTDGGGSPQNPVNKLVIDAKILPKDDILNTDERLVNEREDEELIDRIEELRSRLPANLIEAFNFAHANADISKLSKREYFAHSKIQSLSRFSNKMAARFREISIKPHIQEFATLSVDSKDRVSTETSWNRNVDTEFKILEEINLLLEGDKASTGTITLYTDLPPCSSCKYVIEQFKEKYPKIKIDVLYGYGSNKHSGAAVNISNKSRQINLVALPEVPNIITLAEGDKMTYYNLKYIVTKTFYENILDEKYTIAQSCDRCLAEFNKQILQNNIQSLIVYSTVLSISAHHDSAVLTNFSKEISDMNNLILNVQILTELTNEEKEELQEDVDYINDRFKK